MQTFIIKQLQIQVRMKKPSEISYVKKIYKMLVTSMSYTSSFQYHFHAQHAGHQQQFEAQTKSLINQVYEFYAVDTILDGKQHTIDKMINLQVFIDELNIASVSFDLAKEKIVKEESKSLFRRRFNDHKGYIDYKIISVTTTVISKEQFRNEQDNRNRIYMKKKLDYKNLIKDNERLELQLMEKNRMIQQLSSRISELLDKNMELNKRISQDMQKMKNPLNIKVNILATTKKEGPNTATGLQKIHVDKMEQDLELTKEECAQLKERVAKLQVENKKLQEKCRIFMGEFKEQLFLGDKGKELQKKIADVDTLYLLKQSINQYQRQVPILHSQQIKVIQQVQEEQPKNTFQNFAKQEQLNRPERVGSPTQSKLPQKQNKFQTFSFSPNKGQSKKYLNPDQKIQTSILSPRKVDVRDIISQEKLKNSALFKAATLNQQFKEKGGQSSVSSDKIRASGLIKSISEAIAKDTVISKQQQKLLLIKIQTKQKEIEFLGNELLKKQDIIDRMLIKERILQQLNNELSQEKARLLATSALNAIGSHASTEVLAKIKQLSVYNNQIMKQKEQLNEVLRELKQQFNQRGKRLTEFEGVSRKSLIILQQMGREKELIQSKIKEMVEQQKSKQFNIIEEKNAKYQCLKTQYIQCQSELRQQKQKLIKCELELNAAKQQTKRIDEKLKTMKQTNKSLQLTLAKYQGQRSQHALLSKKYKEIERLQKGIKAFVLRMETEYYKKIKGSNEEQIRTDIKRLFRETYDKINEFEKEYYEVLLTSLKLIEQATDRYYQETNKFYDEIGGSIQKKEQIWKRKADIIKQRQAKINLLKQKQEKIKQKMNKKLMIAEDQKVQTIQGIKRLESRLRQLENYKIHLKELNKEQKFAVPILQINIPQNSMHQPLISMMEMFKSGQNAPPPKQVIPNMKTSGHLKPSAKADMKFKQPNKNIMKIQQQQIQQQQEDGAEKTPFINLSMLKNEKDSSLKRPLSNKPLRESGSWEKSFQKGENTNSKISMLDVQKYNLSKMMADAEKYRESLMLNRSKQSQFMAQRMMLREREMQSLKQFAAKISKLERELFQERNEKQRTIMKYKERLSQFQKQFKMAQEKAEVLAKKSAKQSQLMNIELETLRSELQQKNTLIDRLTEEIQDTNSELLETIAERNDLKIKTEEMIRMIQDYQAAEQILKQQVRQIQQNYMRNEQQMNKIIEERSLQFMHIEKLKSVEIQKLKSVILQIQANLAEEINENFIHKNTIEQMKEQLKKAQSQMEHFKEQSSLTVTRLQNELNEERQMNAALQKEVEIYQKSIMELSYSLEAQQKEVLRLTLIIEKNQSQKNFYKELEENLQEREKNLKQDYLKYDYILSQKNLKIKQWEQNYMKLEQEIKRIEREAQSIKQNNYQLKQDMERVKQRQFRMEREVIQLEKEKSLEEIKNEKLVMLVEDYENEKQKMQLNIQQLNEKIQSFQKSKKNQLECPSSPRSPRSNLYQTSQGQAKQPVNPFASVSLKSKQNDSFQSLRYTKHKGESSLHATPQQRPKPKQQEQKYKEDNSDFLTDKSQSIMKISKVLDPNMESMTIESQNRINKKRPTELLQVKEMKKNKYLNLPSIDAPAHTSGQNSNLGIIQEHNDQMQDTFLKANSPITAKHRKLAQDLQSQEVPYQIQLHQPKRMEQSALAIDMESVPSLHHAEQQNQNGQELNQSEQLINYNEDIYNEYKDYSANQFVQEIIRLRLLIKQLSKRLEQQSYEQNLLQSPIPYVGEIKGTQRSDKQLFERSSRDYIADSNNSKKVQILESHRSAKSINFGDLQIKSLEDQLQMWKTKATEEDKKNAENLLVINKKTLQIEILSQKNEEKQSSIESLMQELKRVSQNNEDLLIQNQRLKVIGRQLKAKLEESFVEFTTKCEQLVSQSLKKDQSLLEVNREFQKQAKIRSMLEEKLDQSETEKKKLQQRTAGLQRQINKNKKQYLKYEEQAQIQIMRLREQNDEFKGLLEKKAEELVVMAEKYVQLEEQKQTLITIVNQTDATRRQYEKNIQKVKGECNHVKNEYDNLEEKRKKVLKETKSLEHENIRLRQQLQTAHHNSTVQIQKYSIKLKEQNQLVSTLKQKLKQKEQVISQLKHEIALYNNQTEQLRVSNQQLSEELIRAEKSLKEIMVSYEQEFKKLSTRETNREEKMQQTKSAVQKKGYELEFKSKEIKNLNTDLKTLREQNADLMTKFQKFKVASAVKARQLQNQVAFKNDKISRLENEVNILQTKLSEEKRSLESKDANNRINVLQNQNEELQAKLEDLYKELTKAQKQLEQSPKIEEYNQLKYKVQLLQSSLKHYSQLAKSSTNKAAEQERQVSDTYKKQLQKVTKLLMREKEKTNHAIDQLRQVVEAFKQLQSKNASMRVQLDSESRANSILKLQNRHLQKLVEQLQKENEGWQKTPASLLSKRSFSRQLTDATLI